ncbi:hypothetical protein LX32DRAFT_407606 [Colletotrichum zoysiae]|uniref:Uncharacterized protein n=1 Tax=Colletotrichum zoysiae TaxID=1216348 RepID=A0AAD9LZC6_9PEZI|nr:hypothetical protein LX32DRAFT_407606 [Colletotrichum zoysiae]
MRPGQMKMLRKSTGARCYQKRQDETTTRTKRAQQKEEGVIISRAHVVWFVLTRGTQESRVDNESELGGQGRREVAHQQSHIHKHKHKHTHTYFYNPRERTRISGNSGSERLAWRRQTRRLHKPRHPSGDEGDSAFAEQIGQQASGLGYLSLCLCLCLFLCLCLYLSRFVLFSCPSQWTPGFPSM